METFLFLLTDGITSGAVYGLVALSLVIVHTVTRVANIGQGEYVMFGAMTLASFLDGAVPPTLGLVLGGGLLCAVLDVWQQRRQGARWMRSAAFYVAAGLVLVGAVAATLALGHPIWASMACALLLVSALGPVVYRLTVSPALNSNAVVLVIISVGVQMALHGMALILWGAEPKSVPALSTASYQVGGLFVSAQSLWIVAVSAAVMGGLYAFFEFTQVGKALRATAMNRRGAQLCGISVSRAGGASFALAACFSGAGGMLVAPLVTANVDMGFLIGLKGFVGATFGALTTYPLSIAGVTMVGTLDAFAAYGLSAYRDAIVFAMVIPVLLWRNGSRQWEGDR
jgi:branched-chain amino acid transport system permease protein